MEAEGFGWREWVMLAAALAGIYLVVALVALARLRHRAGKAVPREPTSRSLLTPSRASPAAWQHPFSSPVPVDTGHEGDVETPEVVMQMSSGTGKSVNTAEPPVLTFEDTLSMTHLEAEIKQLRAEVDAVRKELAELKESRRISPMYAEAAALAQRGFDARGVADECGISVAEAEFVLAMTRDDLTFAEEDPHAGKERKLDAAA